MDRLDGTLRPLAHQPAFPTGQDSGASGVVAGPDGPLWAFAKDRSGRLLMARSDDRGRRWRSLAGPDVRNWFRPLLLAEGSTPRVYLADWAQTGGLSHVWRLDGPLTGTWTEVTPQGGPNRVQAIQELPNGELRYTDEAGHTWQTRDGGTLIERAAHAHVDGADIDVTVMGVVDGMLVATPVIGRRGDRILFSTDNGRHWQVRPVRL